jgi:FMN phosphatase YigB (HAD superfamily)
MAIDSVIFDVDDVVIDTDRACAAAERAVGEPLRGELGDEGARRVALAFSRGYDVLRRQLRTPAGLRAEGFDRHQSRIAAWQRGVLEAGFELKLWSRDTLLALALEDEGFAVTASRIAAVDHYWRTMAEETEIHVDAARIVEQLRGRGIAIHLATNSDGFLRFDESARTFSYDPADAHRRKLSRLDAIRALGLAHRDVTVGDPIGKPKPQFYRRVLDEMSEKLARRVDPARVLVVGDSLTNDVLPFFDAGVSKGAWILRDAHGSGALPAVSDPRVSTIRDLQEIEALLA